MEVLIDQQEYHLGCINCDNYSFTRFIKNHFKKVDSFLIDKLIIATIKENYEDIKKLDKTSFINYIVEKINVKLPFVLQNEKELSSGHYCLYEYNTVIALNNCITIMNKINKKITSIDDEYEILLVLLINNITRNVKGIIALTAIGDDAHGMALFRMLLELIGQLTYLATYDVKEEFVKFQKYNIELQNARPTKDYSLLSDELKKLFSKNKIKPFSQRAESFLLYGWMNASKKITTGKELVKFFCEATEATNTKDILDWYHVASEFVHEDYLWMHYDWYLIRKTLLDFTCACIISMYQELCNILDS